MAESLGVMLGKGAELQALGTVWKISAPDQNAKERLEKLAARVALENVRRLRDTLDPATYKEAFSEVASNLGNYQTWKPGWQSIVFGTPHLFLWSLLQAEHPNVTEATVIEISETAPEEVAAAMSQVLPGFFQILVGPVRKHLDSDQLAKLEQALEQIAARLSPTRIN